MRHLPHPTNPQDYRRARELRRAPSPYEKMLWNALRQNAANAKLKFRRQQPVHPYIADFACMQAKLLIELDGLSHDSRVAYDNRRDAYLRSCGYAIARFANDEISQNLNGVVETILRLANDLSQQAP